MENPVLVYSAQRINECVLLSAYMNSIRWVLIVYEKKKQQKQQQQKNNNNNIVSKRMITLPGHRLIYGVVIFLCHTVISELPGFLL